MSQQTDDGSEQTVAELMTQYTHARHRPPLAESAEVLRARIPGWGADLDPADRPSVPQEVYDPAATGAHWTFPELQPGGEDRERSVEHAFLTPVFGTAQPLRGASGVLSERRRHGLAARLGRGRADVGHHARDPVVAAGPRALAGVAGHGVARRVRGARR